MMRGRKGDSDQGPYATQLRLGRMGAQPPHAHPHRVARCHFFWGGAIESASPPCLIPPRGISQTRAQNLGIHEKAQSPLKKEKQQRAARSGQQEPEPARQFFRGGPTLTHTGLRDAIFFWGAIESASPPCLIPPRGISQTRAQNLGIHEKSQSPPKKVKQQRAARSGQQEPEPARQFFRGGPRRRPV